MHMPNFMSSLKRQYEEINTLIHDELSRPLPNSLFLFELKLKRLRLKEKIHKLR